MTTDSSTLPAHDHQEDIGPFGELVGLRITAWEIDRIEIALQVDRKHLNRGQALHGGMVSTLADAACGGSGTHPEMPEGQRRAVTLSLNIHFIGPGREGSRLMAVGEKIGGGRSIFFSRCEIRDEDGKLVATGEGTFRYVS
ncbi:PaaI family thioesterase [Fodinicurvata halophila]|uniref:PaaI family thioesterase n=1 Tax=Fodinicurvata halophila TaxID=1419723 RepID=A0ABV8URF1_9PROT